MPRVFVALAFAVVLAALSAPDARADSVATIDFPGRISCEVKADNPHPSVKPVGDISGKVNVDCRRWNSAERGVVDRIDIESQLLYYPYGVLLFGETVQTCSDGKGFRYSFGLPCHGPWQGDGRYALEGTVSITVGTEVKTASVGKGGYLAGGNGGPVA